MKRIVGAAGCMGVLAVLLACGVGQKPSKVVEKVTPPSPSPTTAAAWEDVTAKYKEATLGNSTIHGNSQWEPIVGHVVKVEYDKGTRAYRVHADLSSDDLRRQLPGVLMHPGVGACMTIQFWDSKPNGIAVYGNDGTLATKATGTPGVCQDV